MTEQEILDRVLGALKSVAPEIEDQPIDPDKFLRDQIEIDSMDFLNFVNALRTAFGNRCPGGCLSAFGKHRRMRPIHQGAALGPVG